MEIQFYILVIFKTGFSNRAGKRLIPVTTGYWVNPWSVLSRI
jgi:hypothetical protein